nr:hypothetical protein [Bacillus sp. LK2]
MQKLQDTCNKSINLGHTDAAYGPSPLSGQGTSLALIGAYVLAGELKATHDDYSRAFVTYEQEMRKFVEKNQKIGLLAAGSRVEKSRFKIFLRNLTHYPKEVSFLKRCEGQ